MQPTIPVNASSYVARMIAAASNATSGVAFYLVDVDYAVKAVSPTGALLAASPYCLGRTGASVSVYCVAIEPRPHGGVVWVRAESYAYASPTTTGVGASVALDATTLAPVTVIPDSALRPVPSYDLYDESASGGSICTDSAGTAYIIGIGEVWQVRVNGSQTGYFQGPYTVVPNSVLPYAPQWIGVFDPDDVLWLFSVAPWNGTSSFGVWEVDPVTHLIAIEGNLTLPGVHWSRYLFLAPGAVSIDSAGHAYVGVEDGDYNDNQTVYRSIYKFDNDFHLVAIITPPQGADQLNEAQLGFGSSSIAWGSAPGLDRLYASALGNFTVTVFDTSSFALVAAIAPQTAPLFATQFLAYDAYLDSFVAMQPVRHPTHIRPAAAPSSLSSPCPLSNANSPPPPCPCFCSPTVSDVL